MGPLVRLSSFAFVALASTGCGSRTGLLIADLETTSHSDGGSAESSGPDAEPDAADLDVLPPIDVSPPRDVQSDCPDAAATLVYVITDSGALMSFYPPTASFRTIGVISCPSGAGSTPFSMAVDRTGIAYVVFSDGELFRVSTATATCRPTGFVAGARTFASGFGMGYVADQSGGGETLYIAGSDVRNALSGELLPLAHVDTRSFAITTVGNFRPAISNPELTGTGAGDLFAFYATSSADSAIGQIDKTTARVIGQVSLPGLDQGSGWAFAFWGGDFYTFTAPSNAANSGAKPATVVTRYRPMDGSIVPVAKQPDMVVGAGVSTCAPQN